MKNEKLKQHTSCDFETPSAKRRIPVKNYRSVFSAEGVNETVHRTQLPFLLFNFSFLLYNYLLLAGY